MFDSNLIKHGFKISRIKMMKLSGFETYLDLKNNVINAVIVTASLHLNSLPKVLWFDEFKSAEGAMSFLFCDAS